MFSDLTLAYIFIFTIIHKSFADSVVEETVKRIKHTRRKGTHHNQKQPNQLIQHFIIVICNNTRRCLSSFFLFVFLKAAFLTYSDSKIN